MARLAPDESVDLSEWNGDRAAADHVHARCILRSQVSPPKKGGRYLRHEMAHRNGIALPLGDLGDDVGLDPHDAATAAGHSRKRVRPYSRSTGGIPVADVPARRAPGVLMDDQPD